MLEIFKGLFSLETKQRKWGYFGLFILTIINSILEAIGITLILPLIGLVSDQNTVHNYEFLQKLYVFFSFPNETYFLYAVCLTFASVIILKNLYMVMFHYLQLRFIASGAERISQNVFKHYLYLPFNLFIQRNSSEMINNITRQARGIYSLVSSSVINLSADFMVAITMIIILTVVQPVIILFSGCILIPLFIVQYKLYSKKLNNAGSQSLEAADNLLFCLNESFRSIKETKISASEPYIINQFSGIQQRVSKFWIISQVLNRLPNLIAESIMATCVVGALFYLLTKDESSATIFATLGLMGAAFLRLIPMLNRILIGLNTLHEFRSSMNNIQKDLMSPLNREIKNLEQAVPPLTFKNCITYQNVSFRFKDSNESILDNVNLNINKGDLIGIAGETGSGKTTLINLLCGLLQPTTGSITIDGKNIRNQPRPWQLNLAYVPQSVFISDDTVRRNVAFGQSENEIDDERIYAALDKVALGSVLDEMPNGLDTILGEHGSRLSGGQAQRLGIARALYLNRNVLILDEATSALDDATERNINSTINALKGEKTIIMIAHRLNTLQTCDKIIFLKNGKVDLTGSYDELVKKHPTFFKKYEETTT